MSVHNHAPYRPTCNERMVDGELRGACLKDDGTALAKCNCLVAWNPIYERHVWLNGSFDGACGHPASGTAVDA